MADQAHGDADGLPAGRAAVNVELLADAVQGYPLDLDGVRFRPRLAAASAGRARLRSLALLLVLIGHVGVWLGLRQYTDLPPSKPTQTPIQVLLLSRPPPPPPPSPEPPLPPEPKVARVVAKPLAAAPGRMQATTVPVVPESTPQDDDLPPQPKLFSTDGSLLGVREQVQELNRRAGREATFDYQIAGIAEAETAFETKVSIQPDATRFDRYWQPTTDLVTEVLERAVKASTVTMSLPVPGMPGHRVGCAIVLIAATGGCGLSEPKVSVYDIDDPNTLTEAEAEACKIIWEKITTTRQQAEHRRLRAIYDLGCRLPPAGSAEGKAEFRDPG